jgi:integrase
MPAPPTPTNTDTRPAKTNQHYAEAPVPWSQRAGTDYGVLSDAAAGTDDHAAVSQALSPTTMGLAALAWGGAASAGWSRRSTPANRALVLVAALTGMRWGELVALRWDDPRFDQPLDDGAVRGPGRLRIARAISDPRRTGRGVEKGPKTEAGKRVIALDQETVQAFLAHRELGA